MHSSKRCQDKFRTNFQMWSCSKASSKLLYATLTNSKHASCPAREKNVRIKLPRSSLSTGSAGKSAWKFNC